MCLILSWQPLKLGTEIKDVQECSRESPGSPFGADGRVWMLAGLPTAGMREQRVSAAHRLSQHLALVVGRIWFKLLEWGESAVYVGIRWRRSPSK